MHKQIPFFLGPLQITASSGLLSRKPIDMTDRFSSTYCNIHIHIQYIYAKCTFFGELNIKN